MEPTRAGDHARRWSALLRDEVAFRDWYDATLPRVYRYVLARCCGDVALAEELTQQTFMAAVSHWQQFDGRSDPATWLCAIARNKLVDYSRRGRREQDRQARLIGMAPGSDVAWRAAEVRERVECALGEMPADQRTALTLRYLDDLPVRDIGRLFGRSEKATESLLTRAREHFRRAYGAGR